jgi:hypothetical protein
LGKFNGDRGIDTVSSMSVYKYDSDYLAFAISRLGRLSIVDVNSCKQLTVTPTDAVFTDFTFLEGSKTLVLYDNTCNLSVYSISEKKKHSPIPEIEEKSDVISLNNLQPLKYIGLERLPFTVCAPVSMEVYGDVEGGTISWDIGVHLREGTPSEMKWEIEFSQECMIDSLEFHFAFSSEKEKEIETYLISLSYLDEKTGSMGVTIKCNQKRKI